MNVIIMIGLLLREALDRLRVRLNMYLVIICSVLKSTVQWRMHNDDLCMFASRKQCNCQLSSKQLHWPVGFAKRNQKYSISRRNYEHNRWTSPHEKGMLQRDKRRPLLRIECCHSHHWRQPEPWAPPTTRRGGHHQKSQYSRYRRRSHQRGNCCRFSIWSVSNCVVHHERFNRRPVGVGWKVS